MIDSPEVEKIKQRYERRRAREDAHRYSPLDPYVLMAEKEKDQALGQMLESHSLTNRLPECNLLEIGCGSGNNLLRFLRLGFRPDKLTGNDLLPDRLRTARKILPSAVQLIAGDATTLELVEDSFDIVCLFTVFSSILDDEFQQRLAAKAWSLVKPGGGVLCYDFIYNNPANPDVRAVPIQRLRELFPHGTMQVVRVTLAPPIGRRVTRLWSGSYSILNRLPVLRSHVLAWLQKDALTAIDPIVQTDRRRH